MIDFVEYVVGELSSRRLGKADALALIRQFQTGAEVAASETPPGSLLRRNTSDFGQQSYEVVFTGDEPFLRDHVVNGHRILPGVAYLEMARQAVRAALPDAGDAALEIRNVVWAQPIVVDERRTITIALFPADSHARDGAIDYEIYSVAEEDAGGTAERIHSQGQLRLVPGSEPLPHQDFTALRARMTRGRVDDEQLYAVFDAMGMTYGPAQRAVRRLHLGHDEVLAHLVLPDVWQEGDDYVLHPSVMDAALQSALGFAESLDAAAPPRARLPYALDRLRILSACTGEMVAWLRLSPEPAASGRVTRIDIDLCDAQGNVCVEWRGFSSRELGGAQAETSAQGVLHAAPQWEIHTDAATAESAPTAGQGDRHVLACAEVSAAIQGIEGVQVDTLDDDPSRDHAARYEAIALACFAWVRRRFESRPSDPVLLQLVVPDDATGQLLFGLSGLLRSAALENPAFTGQIVALPADVDSTEADAWLKMARQRPQDTVQRFERDGTHASQVWHELVSVPDAAPQAYRDGGVYVITGGLGGLGVLFARDIAARCAEATIVLTGRASAEDAMPRIEAVGLPADRIVYRQLDLADAEAVRVFVEGVMETQGRLDGVLHCAGQLHDGLVLTKTDTDVREVLAPKVAGTVHLDEATRALGLDFFVLFSGGASVTGNVGQTDYAAANGFMDRYAAHRNALMARGERHGVTRAINWPLWREGGMGVSAETLEHARRITGVEPLDTAAGLEAFHRVLALPHDQVQLVQGDVARLRRVLFPAITENSLTVDATTGNRQDLEAPVADDALQEGARGFMRRQLSALLKLPPDQIEMEAPFEKYGINSIMMMNLTNALEDAFGSLPKTLFFEYQTLEELTGYFVRAHAPTLARLLAGDTDAPRAEHATPTAAARNEAAAQDDPDVRSRSSRRRQRFAATALPARDTARHDEPVAIVGLSGRYPGARDLEAYWRNLRDGIDSIEEVPADRWDWRDYFTEDRSRPGHHYSKWGGFIEGVDEFDALFFNIPPVDAERIDPQERVFLEHAWMAVEDAGYTRAGLQIPHGSDQAGQVGVYVGVMYGEYQLFGAEASLIGQRGVTPSSYASIANRVSYFMNLHGPSMALDTMCSSSLTAIHLACQDLRQGRTDLAIAGGVNLTIHPNKYLLLSSGQFIATDGRCQSFGKGGDGYIPAEGVGVSILKRLSEAVRDGNHIYGVIRGSALNHGGKTNGYSVPNPQSQANVIAMALTACGVDARRIGYLEAHGTGTKLGDPIEIAALTTAFRKFTDDNGFCLIGSAKSNIGHAESAAGIAGLTKVLLQLKHGMIAPSLHASVLNPHIDFANTPFEVNRVLRPWVRPEIDGRPAPRLAGLSSFGAGGSNAHLVIEEYIADAATADRARPHAILLSARTAEQIEQKVRDLLAFVRDAGQKVSLADLAYTLQIGREAMEERFALVTDALPALGDALERWLTGGTPVAEIHRGRANASGGALAVFNTDSDLQATIDRWFATGRLSRLADLWVQGVAIDWRKAHDPTALPKRVSLPTYPFARDRCWVDRTLPVSRTAAGALHPLLHENVSDLHGQAYRSTFHGQEFFLDDHRVRLGNGAAQKLLPGVAYLEMMRAAALDAVPEWREGGVELADIAWTRPLSITAPTKVTIALEPDDRGDLAVRIGTGDDEDGVVHGSGRVRALDADAPAPLDLAQLRERLTQGRLDGEALYERYAHLGIDYGRTFRSVDHVRLGHDEVLAELHLPAAVAGSADAFWLHPSMLDGALQSAIGLLVAAGRDLDRVPLPFALRSAQIYAPCAQTLWAWVRPAQTRGVATDVVELDIDLCDDAGNVCASLRGLASRASRPGDAIAPSSAESDVVMATPSWTVATVPSASPVPVDGERREVLLCDLSNVDVGALADALPGWRCVASNGAAMDDLAERYGDHARVLLERLQETGDGPRRLQVVVPGTDPDRITVGLEAMLRTAAMEQPVLHGQIVCVPAAVDARTLSRHLQEAASLREETLVDCTQPAPRLRRWELLAADGDASMASAFRDDGVYLVTGGMGGLGQLFARHILSTTTRAQVILTGRGTLDAERQAQFDALSGGVGRLQYRVLDPTDDDAVHVAIDGIVREFGALHGLLHSAGMTRDGLLPTKTAAQLDTVLAPKVAGTLALDAATAALDLDFFALFASVSGALGNIGQADYAAANGFLDQFAAYRNRLVAYGQRQGRTVSIDWPLWAEGGMGLEPAAADLLWRTAGVRPLPTAEGLAAFERSLLATDAPQVLVLSGDAQRLRRLITPRATEAAPRASAAVVSARAAAIAEPSNTAATSDDAQAETFLRELFGRVLKVPAQRIDPRASLEQYGIDSVVAMTLTAELETLFGELPKTLLFEHQTVERLARHLRAAFPERLREIVAPVTPAQSVSTPVRATVPVARERTPVPNRFRGSAPARERQVAIVGVAGRYPQADSLERFWDNLRAGRDCITEVPADRWDHTLYFDPNRNRPGRTYSKWGGFLADIDKFDALFFNVSPREAALLDPQERLFLETAWETLEDAGYARERVAGRRIGVYVGVMWGQYELYAPESTAGVPTSSHASIANRVSYFFDFHGPSLALDTMCSSSLSAVHLAAEDIRRGTVEAAIVGGVNLSLHPQKYLNLGQGNFMSSDGRCRSFGAGGDGYVPGEGVGAVLLKPLDDALRDGDRIHAILEASALNHGGKTHGYTVPNPVAQAELIAEVLKKAGIDPRGIGYIETHGTGTSLGDPIELAGLRDAFAAQADGQGTCAIGSVKSNIGHLEGAAGIAALTKALLQIRHGELVPSLHAEPANPHIDFANSRFRVQTQLAPWPRRDGQPRRAAVSAFGAGGANAHLIVAEYLGDAREDATRDISGEPELFLLSARDEAALVRYAHRMIDFLDRAPSSSLRDIAATSRVGRTALSARLAIVADSLASLRERLSRWASAQSAANGTGLVAHIEDCHAARVVDAGAGGLIAGDSGQAFLAELLERSDWRALARLWVAGAEIDWMRSPGAASTRRVGLPTYPFARERYWVHSGHPTLHVPHAARVPAPAVAAMASAPTVPHAQTLLYRPEWGAQPIDAPTDVVAGPVLVLDASLEWRTALAARLGGVATVHVAIGETFEAVTADRYIVNPARDEDLDRLVAALQAADLMPRAIVHRIASAGTKDGEVANIAHDLDRTAHLSSALAKALMAHRHAGETRFLSIVSGDSANDRSLGVALGGFYASLHQENPTWRTKVVECVSTNAGASVDDVDVAVAELSDTVWDSAALRVSLQADDRLLRERRRWAPLAPSTHAPDLVPFKSQGVYLITGGMGALGSLIAETLARRHQARLALVGRSPSGEASERRLEALRALGGEAIYVQADIADAAQADAAVRAVREQFGRIDGVLHVAGLHRDALLLKKTRADRAAVYAAKVPGAVNLDHATRNDALDLFVSFASVAGALGNAGQTDYAFANHFLDAFSDARAARVALGLRHGRSLSIDWPLWAVDGMRPHDDVVAASARVGLSPLPAEAGLAAWERLLSADVTQVMVLHGDPARIDAALRMMTRSPVATGPAASAPDGIDLVMRAQAYLRERIGEEIGLEPSRVDANERFDAFGIDSMMVARINERMTEDLGALPKTLFYEYSTVAELAGYLVREMAAPLSQLLEAPVAVEARAVPAAPAPTHPVPSTAPVPAVAEAARPATDEPIAIVGMHGYYPGSADLDALWTHLRQGDDLIDVVPANRWDAEAFHDPDPANASQGRIYCKWGAFLDDHDMFDAAFFRIGDAEAASIDPQERLFLQSVWAAFEDAGMTRDDLRRRFPKGKSASVGVYVGVTTNSYHLLGADTWQEPDGGSPSSLPWSIANRVSYVFDFQGASLPVDTACSSSLVAIHLACESLRRGESQVAVAGGVNLYLHPAKYHGLCQRRMLAVHGKCRSYGDGDDGFIPGEGIGSLILKPLSRARRDGDRIHGVILASGQDHSGRANGYSAPNPNSQAALIADVLHRAGVDAAGIGYVEGHGTGTQLGDSLEVRALTQAFGQVPAQSCVLGSIKANIGHTESAAGVLGVTKVLLQMRHGELVPSIHADPPNPDIEFARTPFRMLGRAEAWSASADGRRRALVNSFGAGGVNACLVLEAYEDERASPKDAAEPSEELFVLSARSEERLRTYARAWVERLGREDLRDALPAIARTLREGREAMPVRLAIVAMRAPEVAERLQAWLNGHDDAVYGGGAGGDRTDKGLPEQGAGMRTAVAQVGDLHGMARAWVAGADAPWSQTPRSIPDRPVPVSLPTYPFEKIRHWPKAHAPRATFASAVTVVPPDAARLHPLVSHNASNLRQTRFTSLLSREAFYAKDHRVNDQRLLPGSAWLEIARAAGSLATVTDVRRLRDIVFVRPLAFVEPVQIAVTTLQAVGDEVLCTIASQDPVHGTVVHAECALEPGTPHAGIDAARRIPIAELIGESTKRIDGETCYARFGQAGIDYGPTFRTIQEMHVGEGFVLARLSLASSLWADAGEYGLHPSVIDGALQSISGFAEDDRTSGPFLPFAIELVEIHGMAPADCFVHAVESTGTTSGKDGLRKFDIDVATAEGAVVASLKGLTVRALKPQPSSVHPHSSTRFS